MLDPSRFLSELCSRGIEFFVGVPDSLLSNFTSSLDSHAAEINNVTAANEGNAVAIAAGYHLATNSCALVYMQNSGLGNAVNPLLSLADPAVYKIPMILLIGWRGEPGKKDEPQHMVQGALTEAQLKLMGVPYQILGADSSMNLVIDNAINEMSERGSPVAILVKTGTFSKFTKDNLTPQKTSTLSREEALEVLLGIFHLDDIVIATTGKASREIYEIRLKNGIESADFLCVGSMGHASSIALGVALGKPRSRVICLDGDGALLMHMGALPIIADHKLPKYLHILLNNASHESVGGQRTVADAINFSNLSIACGYKKYYCATTSDEIKLAWNKINLIDEGPIFFEIKINASSRDDLMRPNNSPENNKLRFMEILCSM